MSLPVQFRRSALIAAAVGVAYGLSFRLLFNRHEFDKVFGVMTVGFLFLVPFAVGYLTVAVGERKGAWPWPARIFVPWLTSVAALAGALLLAWEGLICLFLWLPLFIIEATLGALLAVWVGWLLRRRRAGAGQGTAALFVALLPLIATPLEHRLELPNEIRTVHSSIDIAASPEAVWREIARVPAIDPAELRFSLARAIGFPRPIEATLSHEGVGGVRQASFAGGVVFVETVTVWEPGERLEFRIAADPNSIPMRTLDQHVTVGGEFFDVLEGMYRIERFDDGVRLHLSSRHRVSTRFNVYARLWTDFVMSDIQRSILQVVAQRSTHRMLERNPRDGSKPL
jgi:hypothetical protein